ncbi:hypothetical protein PG989_003869 [Apiospora arundinis]
MCFLIVSLDYHFQASTSFSESCQLLAQSLSITILDRASPKSPSTKKRNRIIASKSFRVIRNATGRMGDILMTSPRCEDPSQYQSTTRTVLETLLWVSVIAAYVPQYIGIKRAGTKGISPYYVLNHGLFSTTTLALRLSHSVSFPAFTCVASHQLWGWKGYSALLGFVEVIVQWLCSVILLVIYIRYRTVPEVTVPGPSEARARRMSDWLPEEAHAHKLTSTRMRFILGIYAAITLPISLGFLLVGALPSSPEQSHRSTAYTVSWTIWITILCALDAFLVVFQFIKQMKTVGRVGTRGSLSITSIALQSVALVLMSVSQFYRTQRNFVLRKERPLTLGKFLALFFYVYGCVSVDVMYLVAGLGYLVLFQLCLLFDWNDLFSSRFGRIRLL